MNYTHKLPIKRIPRSRNPKGFALIIALTLMSFIVVLVLSLATFLNVEMHTASHQSKLDEARANALLGAQVALGQLQIYAGPDQRVTANATVVYPEKTGPGEGEIWDIYRQHATGIPTRGGSIPWKTFLEEDFEGDGINPDFSRDTWEEVLDDWWETDLAPEARKHPHWLGVWDSEIRATGDDISENPSLRLGDFKRDQTPRWLISGNESLDDDEQYTPIDTFNGPNSPELIQLVGYGSAARLDPDGSGDAAESTDGLDGAVYAPKVEITDAEGILEGYYAYWVGDENTKANFGIRDPYFEETNIASKRYRNRLQVPQRLGWEQVAGFKEVFDSYSESQQDDLINSDKLERIETTSQISLIDIDRAEEINDASRQSFHHITGFSKGIFTDTARGGLQKDLTQFFNLGASATNGDFSEEDPIPNPGRNDKLGYDDDERFVAYPGARNDGFPNSDLNIPTWGELRDWYQNEVEDTGDGQGEIDVTEETSPIISQVRIFWGISNNNGTLRFHILPQVMLWNTYDVGLKNANYELRLKNFSVTLNRMQVASAYPSGTSDPRLRVYDKDGTEYPFYFHTLTSNGVPAGHDNYTGNVTHSDVVSPTAENGEGPYPNFPMADFQIFEEDDDLIMNFSTDFKAGEHLVFTVGTNQAMSISGEGPVIALENTFLSSQAPSAYKDFGVIDVGPGIPNYQSILIDGSGESGFGGTRLFEDNSFDIELYANGTLLRDFGKYNAGAITVGFNGIRGVRYIGDQPMSWRQLHNSSDFDLYIVGQDEVSNNDELDHSQHSIRRDDDLQYGLITHAITTAGEIYTDPLYRRGAGTIASKREGSNTVWRPFANYNIMAKKFSDMHPVVDEARADGHWTNPEGTNRFTAVYGGSTSNSNQFKIMDFFNPGTHLGNSFDGSSNSNIGERGKPWDSQIGTSYVTEENGRMRSFSMLQRVSQPSGATQQLRLRQKSIPMTIMPARLAFRPEFDLISIGQLQQVNLSPFMWQPANAIGNSEANTYVDREAITGLHSRPIFSYYRRNDDQTVYLDNDGDPVRRTTSEVLPNNVHNHLLDLSYLLNDALWDRYFLSTIPTSGSLAIDNSETLDNSRIKFDTSQEFSLSDVRDYDNAARYLHNVGAFNVNSTSVEAWKALIMAFRDLKMKPIFDNDYNPDNTVPISRTLNPLNGSIDFTFDSTTNDPQEYGAVSGSNLSDYSKIYGGFRYLTDEMCEVLAERIVDEVRLRGPFFSLSDFVNRRLQGPEGTQENGSYWTQNLTTGQSSMSTDYDPIIGLTGLNGALQRAINVSGINGGVNYPNVIGDALRRYDSIYYPYQISDGGWGDWHTDRRFSYIPAVAYYTDNENKAGVPVGETGQLLSHSPGFLTQADLMSMLGPVLRPRGDTFIIRTYGNSVNKLTGEVDAEAWLELTVQRVTKPVIDANDDYEPDEMGPGDGPNPGRRFEIVNFRWLTKDEV